MEAAVRGVRWKKQGKSVKVTNAEGGREEEEAKKGKELEEREIFAELVLIKQVEILTCIIF
ncbi:uncharacterized protein G2W53_036785 [Senna tora]|uniref:Uncharacterized protein n=1 Tax=Senna tora TaxID=362788 RepID=A0A834SUM2_9FABA|nr:uncharacterized protein G2W53_036785 [Senna tora]